MISHHRFGPFLTKVIHDHEDGSKTVTTSRRQRKVLLPLLVRADGTTLSPAHPASAWLHLWEPRKLGWWIAVHFLIGSALFMIGAFFATWPHAFPGEPQQMNVFNWIFFIGSIFFTAAAYLQWLQSMNGDVAESGDGNAPKRWHWCAWKPHNLGYLASLVQLVGTVFFNFNTGDAMIGGLSWEGEDLLIWTPNIAGSLCFLVASYLAYLEVSHRFWSWQPRNLSWWITVINLWGSIFFQISAFYSFVPQGGLSDHAGWLAGLYTFLGGVFFLVGSYLLVPEMFEEGATEE
jgi:hypothetical protein